LSEHAELSRNCREVISTEIEELKMAKFRDSGGYRGEGIVVEIKVDEECECEEARGRWDGFNIDTTHVKGTPGVLWGFSSRPRGLGNRSNSG
jgi:hypothetical protein